MTAQHSRKLLLLVGLMLAGLTLLLGRSQARAADSQWFAQFWNNKNLQGAPVLQRYENTIDFNWGDGSPDYRVPDDNFSAQWTKRQYFDAGTYQFIATMDDAMRVWVDGQLIIDSWYDSQEHTEVATMNLAQGDHDIRVDYYEAGGVAIAVFTWQKVGAGGVPAQFYNWKGEYFNNITLTGTPSLVRDDRFINFDWGEGSPAPQIFNDYFSVRWTKTFDTLPGTYKFFVTSDDGVRVWVNNQLVINNWQNQPPTRVEGTYVSSGGPVTAVVEYYEAVGGASITTGWVTQPGGTAPTPPPPTSNCPNPPSGLEAVVINAATLNVRQQPSTSAAVIGRLSSCQKVPLTGYRTVDNAWVMIWYTSGVAGWVSSNYVQLGVPMNQLSPVNYP